MKYGLHKEVKKILIVNNLIKLKKERNAHIRKHHNNQTKREGEIKYNVFHL